MEVAAKLCARTMCRVSVRPAVGSRTADHRPTPDPGHQASIVGEVAMKKILLVAALAALALIALSPLLRAGARG